MVIQKTYSCKAGSISYKYETHILLKAMHSEPGSKAWELGRPWSRIRRHPGTDNGAAKGTADRVANKTVTFGVTSGSASGFAFDAVAYRIAKEVADGVANNAVAYEVATRPAPLPAAHCRSSPPPRASSSRRRLCSQDGRTSPELHSDVCFVWALVNLSTNDFVPRLQLTLGNGSRHFREE